MKNLYAAFPCPENIMSKVCCLLLAFRPDVCQILWVLIALKSRHICLCLYYVFVKNNQHLSEIGFKKLYLTDNFDLWCSFATLTAAT